MKIETLHTMVAQLKACAVPPKRIETQEHADCLNELHRELGLDPEWRVGDDYYEIWPNA